MRTAPDAALLGCLLLVLSSPTMGLDQISLMRDGQSMQVTGRILMEAEDGSLLVCGLGGDYWTIRPDEIVARESDDRPFQPLSGSQVATDLLHDLPDGFREHSTAHYVILYNTSRAYAEWCGALFERLYIGFYAYWRHLGFQLSDPALPLVALVFEDHATYADHARQQLGNDIGSTIGYYNMQSNRINTYDLTGVERATQLQGRFTPKRISNLLSQPRAAKNVATIVHEATHQLAYNSGLQVRFADNPFWVSEGLAVYFETPNLRSSRGWRGIGRVNVVRLERFYRFLSHRANDSLVFLLSDDGRFRDPKSSADSYAEAWALDYFLLNSRKADYVSYLKKLAQRRPVVKYDARERLADFKLFFGPDLAEFDKQFLRFMYTKIREHRKR